MMQDQGSSSQNQGIEPERHTSKKITQKRRMPGIVSIIVYFLTATGIIVYAFVENIEVNFHKIAQNQTPTETCYRREEKENYPVLINLGLGLMAILIALTVRCFCDFIEELCQLSSRDWRSIFKLFKRCFIGVPWGPISVVFLIDMIACIVAKKSFKPGDIIYILGGIGVSPLVAYLLNLNTQTEVNLSRDLEKKGLYPARALAWNCYHYLKNVLPIFNKCFTDSNSPLQDRDRDPKTRLSVKKMFLLFAYDGETKTSLDDQDKHFTKIADISEGGYNFPVFCLTLHGMEYKCVIQYAEEASTLHMMCMDESVKCIHKGDLEDQVKLLYTTLASEILSKDDKCRNKCILVQTAENLSSGGLAHLIMDYIRVDEGTSKTKKPDETPTPARKTVPPLKTDVPFRINITDESIVHCIGDGHVIGHSNPNQLRRRKIPGLKSGCPEESELYEISRQVAHKWKQLAKILLSNIYIDMIDLFGCEVEEKTMVMFEQWRHSGSAATYRLLYEALVDVDRRDIAEQYCVVQRINNVGRKLCRGKSAPPWKTDDPSDLPHLPHSSTLNVDLDIESKVQSKKFISADDQDENNPLLLKRSRRIDLQDGLVQEALYEAIKILTRRTKERYLN